MKVVIAGSAKTGTTALFHIILAAMPPGTRELFEPPPYAPAGETHALAKVIIRPDTQEVIASFAGFDKHVHIVRDPRDTVISRVLYSIYHRPDIWGDPARAESFVALLRRKERDPRAVSIQQIVQHRDNLPEPSTDSGLFQFGTGLAFFREHPEYFRVSYEAMVAGELGPLSKYLGLALHGGKMTDSIALRRVARSRGAGNWRSWFTAADVAALRPIIQPVLTAYGCDDDWTLDPEPRIEPAASSQYIDGLIMQARRDFTPPLWRRIGSHIKRVIFPVR